MWSVIIYNKIEDLPCLIDWWTPEAAGPCFLDLANLQLWGIATIVLGIDSSLISYHLVVL